MAQKERAQKGHSDPCKLKINKSAYEVKNNSCLFERLFKVKKNGVFVFGISFRFRDIHVFVLCK